MSELDSQVPLDKEKSIEPTADQISEELSTHEKQPIPDATFDDFPDGGIKAWSIAIGTSLVLFCTMGMINTYGVFQAYYQTHQLANVSPSDISWIGSLQVFFLFSSALVGGPLFDRYGAKVSPSSPYTSTQFSRFYPGHSPSHRHLHLLLDDDQSLQEVLAIYARSGSFVRPR